MARVSTARIGDRPFPRPYPEPDDEVTQPSDAYLVPLLTTENPWAAKKRDDLPLHVLRWLYWQEQAKLWLTADGNAEMVPVTIAELEQEWSVELDALLPLPVLSLEAKGLLDAYTSAQNKPTPDQDALDVVNAEVLQLRSTAGAEAAQQEINTRSACNLRRFWQVRLWAWQRRRLVYWGEGIYHLKKDPPERLHDRLFDDMFERELGQRRDQGGETGEAALAPRRQPNGPRHPSLLSNQLTILSAPPISSTAEAIWDIASKGEAVLLRQPNSPPQKTTSNGNTISFGGAITLVIDPAQEATLVQEALEHLDDDAVATLFVLLARWFANTDGRDPLGYTRIHVNELLACCGREPQPHGGYTTLQKQSRSHVIQALARVYVKGKDTAYEGKGKQRRSRPIFTDGVLLDVSVGSEDLYGQAPYWFDFRPGAWAREYLTEDNWKTAHLLRRILCYDASRPGVERMALRLGLYYTLQWRNRASGGNYAQSFMVSTVLARTCLPLPTDRRRFAEFRDQFERAHDLLQKDEIIGTRDTRTGELITDWRYDKGDDADLPQYKWFPKWLKWTALIPPPTPIKEGYAEIAVNKRLAGKTVAKRDGRQGLSREQ